MERVKMSPKTLSVEVRTYPQDAETVKGMYPPISTVCGSGTGASLGVGASYPHIHSP